MARGKVLYLDQHKGYAVIRPEGEPGDIFMPAAAITAAGRIQWKKGDRVRFDSVRGPKGRYAANVEKDSVL